MHAHTAWLKFAVAFASSPDTTRTRTQTQSRRSAAGARAAPDAQSDILNALLALGYSDKEALLALKTVPTGASVSDGIKQALKALSKG